jgi:hypothetical protein
VISNSESTASLVWINSISRARAEVARVFLKAWVISPPPDLNFKNIDLV